MTNEKTKTIARLNDEARRLQGTVQVLMTRGITELEDERGTIMAKVIGFNDFTEDNDPHGEHDFGSFDHNGQKIFWKIDYYDPTMTRGSEDPADPEKTKRVLTIMLAREY